MPRWKLQKARDMRRCLTPAEAKLTAALRDKSPVRVRSQAPMYGYIADIYIAKARLVVEVDGSSHMGREARDALRDARLAEHGLLTIRVGNGRVMRSAGQVADEILAVAVDRMASRANNK